MPYLLLAHVVAALVSPILARRWGRSTLLIAALAPASAAAWLLTQTRAVFTAAPARWQWEWVPGLELGISFRLDTLSWVMGLVVTVVGTLVMIYASRYFASNARGLARFTSVFVAFAGAMLGLVTAEHLMMVYLFWEATTVLSFLLIGHHYDRRYARAAARQAIQVTSVGSLAMFAGFVMVASPPGGSYQMSVLIMHMETGIYQTNSPIVWIGAILIIWGIASKSALVPHHFWLPGAMAAPTPVSAYLHAAAMVKAGVYLTARLTPGFVHVPGWSAILVTFGLATMVVGGYRALRQFDLKLILAYSTVSQLGLMTAAFAYGTAASVAAGYALLIAHATFKSALFMSVGLVEKTTGTRDLRELNSLYRHQPVLAAAAGVAAASMAGIPLLLGFLGKEALLVAFIHPQATAWIERLSHGATHTASVINVAALLTLVGGSILTFAYSWRYWWGAFAPKRTRVENPVTKCPRLSLAPIVILAAASLTGVAPQIYQPLISDVTAHYSQPAHLALWSGWEPAVLTAFILVMGTLMAKHRPAVARFQRRVEPKHLQLTDLYRWTLLELETLAARVTTWTQRGSLPWDVSTILIVLVAVVGYGLASIPDPELRLRLWDSPYQLALVILAITATIITVRARHRMKAVLALGAVGTLIAMIYLSYGAPDLALTQIVVEVITLVVFVLVLRSLPPYFSNRPLVRSRWIRFGIAAALGTSLSLATAFAIQARVSPPVSELIPAEALVFGAGENIVNVILVDVRAWDTVGELSVLLVTATGVASLIYLNRRFARHDNHTPSKQGQWLPAVELMAVRERSVMLEVGTRLLFPTMLVASFWVTLVGHNHPGGGFAGGLLAGIAVVMRYLAGGRFELGQTLSINPGRLLGLGLFTAAVGGALPLLRGQTVLQSVEIHLNLGWVGDLHFTSAMILDIGVYILVLGLVLDLVTALGAQIDRDRDLERGNKSAQVSA
ncbi:MAG: Na+/H+ antiporter subunit A [Actinomycetaceae bacterium]|nr:Na+/H+ antiporter subunit A [Actinomycetaceae bacterium]